MADVDTSAETVERLAVAIQAWAESPGDSAERSAATLRALLAERDAAFHEANAGRQAEADADAERDAARAEIARLREALAAIERRAWPNSDPIARAALASTEGA